tara:strand:+ start:1116 stop:1322 length:207 start_codon:yes stop_codon:yes gene_type:complete
MFFKFISKRKKDIKKKIKSKFRMNDWMDLTKEERLELDFREKNKSMIKKKELLKSIRDEYIKKIKNKK